MRLTPSLFVPFLYGAFLGSFLNVCIYRLPRGTSIVLPPSSCTTCKEPVRWWRNVPILSYIFLRGKCASCGSPISPRYLFLEVLTGILMAFVWERNQFQVIGFGCDLAFSCLLLVITVIDWDFLIILDSTVYLGTFLGLLCSYLHHQLFDAALAAVVGALIFYAIRVVGEFVFLKEAMGEGDVKLAAMLGAFLGLKGVVMAICLSFPIGVMIALGLMAVKLKNRKDYIPFGPAMALSAFIVAFWGNPIMDWYLFIRYGI